MSEELAQFTAADMTTSAADGFRGGVMSANDNRLPAQAERISFSDKISAAIEFLFSEGILTHYQYAEIMEKKFPALIQRKCGANDRKLSLSAMYRGKRITINIDDVDYFIADNKYVTAYYAGSKLIIDESLAEIVRCNPEFVLINRPILVRRTLLEAMHKGKDEGKKVVSLKCLDVTLPVSRSKVSEIRAVIAKNKTIDPSIRKWQPSEIAVAMELRESGTLWSNIEKGLGKGIREAVYYAMRDGIVLADGD